MVTTATTAHYRDLLCSEILPRSAEPAWVTQLRQDAMDRFAAQGFPTTRLEEWRFTPVSQISETTFGLPSNAVGATESIDASSYGFGDSPCTRLVFVNGLLAPELTVRFGIPPSVHVLSMAEARSSSMAGIEPWLGEIVDYDRHPFAALNTAMQADGAFVHVPPGMVVEVPIHLVFVTIDDGSPKLVAPRNLVVAEAGSDVKVIESYVSIGTPGNLTVPVTEIVVHDDASVVHCKVQQESTDSLHVGVIGARLHRSARLSAHTVSLGGALARTDTTTVLAEPGADCTMNGLYIVNGTQLADNHTTIDHAAANCTSHELYKGILDGRGRGVFNGKVYVRPDAQKTDAKQTNRALLLSEHARIDTKPQLEIFADDVRCTHGATVGHLDNESMFYLRSRGIADADARNILIHAFASDMVEQIPIEAVRAKLEQALLDALPQPSLTLTA